MAGAATGFEAMWAHVGRLGEQLRESFAAGAAGVSTTQVSDVLVCGMGGSAAAAELVAGILDPDRMRVRIHRDYDLAGAPRPGTLLVFSSYSGNTEEVLAAWDSAENIAPDHARVVISSGGELVARAADAGVPHLGLPPGLPPRASLGHGVGVLCALLERVGDPGLAGQVPAAVAALEAGNHRWGLVGEGTDDALERLARSLDGRLPVIWSGCPLTHAVARRWRAQINENAKLLVSTAELPELDHNEVVGWGHESPVRDQVRVVALRDESEHPRVAVRFTATREALGLDPEVWFERHAPRGCPLERMMSLVQEGDVLSCLIAREAGVEPVGVEVIDRIKQSLSAR
jgi:glucose/mannose-6-phosphate isomerase